MFTVALVLLAANIAADHPKKRLSQNELLTAAQRGKAQPKKIKNYYQGSYL
jgi:hypothetical protein